MNRQSERIELQLFERNVVNTVKIIFEIPFEIQIDYLTIVVIFSLLKNGTPTDKKKS